MLLWLTEFLSEYISGFSVFQYLTFRTMVSVVTALAMSLLIGPYVIERLSHHQIGQTVREDGPESHGALAWGKRVSGQVLAGRSAPGQSISELIRSRFFDDDRLWCRLFLLCASCQSCNQGKCHHCFDNRHKIHPIRRMPDRSPA